MTIHTSARKTKNQTKYNAEKNSKGGESMEEGRTRSGGGKNTVVALFVLILATLII